MGPRFRPQKWDRKIFNFSREFSARTGFFSSPESANWPCPGASPSPAADQACSSPESQSIAGPTVSYAASGFLIPRPAELVLALFWILALRLVSPLPPESRIRRSQPFSAILFFHPVEQLLLFSKFASFCECQPASLRRWFHKEFFCPVCQRLRFLSDLVLRPRRHILPPTLPVVHKFYGGPHIPSHNPDAQSSSHLERPRPVTSTLPGLGTASHTCSLALNLLFNFSKCHCQLSQFALPTILHGPGALTKKAVTVGTTA